MYTTQLQTAHYLENNELHLQLHQPREQRLIQNCFFYCLNLWYNPLLLSFYFLHLSEFTISNRYFSCSLPLVQSMPPTAYSTPTVDFLGLVRGLCNVCLLSGNRWYLRASIIRSWQSRSSRNSWLVSTWSAMNCVSKIKNFGKMF